MSDYFWLSDEQFGRLAPLLPSDTRGVPRVDDCRVISGNIHVLQSGSVAFPDLDGLAKELVQRLSQI